MEYPTKLPVDAPVVSVTVLEDRAQVLRHARIALSAGVNRLLIKGVAPVLADKSLHAEVVSGAVTVSDARILRERRELRAERPERIRELELALDEALAAMKVLTEESSLIDIRAGAIDQMEELILKELQEDASWDRDSRNVAAQALDGNSREMELLALRKAELQTLVKQQQLEVSRCQERLTAACNPASHMEASIELTLTAPAEGICEMELHYTVPGACWRPAHIAEKVADGRIVIHSQAAVWQNTGEDWSGVQLRFSTERPSLGTEPPELENDVLETRPKQPVVQVQTREQTIQTTGLGTSRSEPPELPGIDDGGDALLIDAAHPVDVPSDGRAHRIPYTSFETEASHELVLFPELAPAAIWKSEQSNRSTRPLLAGPVELLGDGGILGRTQCKLIAPNERFALSWGSEPSVRVHRHKDTVEQEPGLISSWLTTTHDIAIRLSNIGSQELTVRVTERIPVSEIEQVEIVQSIDKTTERRPADENGFVSWNVRLQPFGHQQVNLAYSVRRRKEVQL